MRQYFSCTVCILDQATFEYFGKRLITSFPAT
jgi:hypothetical protein